MIDARMKLKRTKIFRRYCPVIINELDTTRYQIKQGGANNSDHDCIHTNGIVTKFANITMHLQLYVYKYMQRQRNYICQ